jgi:hypothetical protein
LRMDNDLRRAVEEAVGGEGLETGRQSFVDARAWRDDGYADGWGQCLVSLPSGGVSRHNRRQ